LGYDHFSDSSLDSAFAYDNHSAESVNASAALRVSASTVTGIDTAVNYSYYEQNFHNPSIAFSGGPFIEQKLSRYLDLRLSGGIQEIQFKSGGTNGDTSSLNGWYSNISLAHRINRFCTETLVGGHESTLALQTNYQTIDYLRYSLSFKLLKKITTSLNVFYEHVAESPGLKSETLDQFGGGLQLGYQLTKKLSLNGGCQTVTKQSNISGSNYLQNRLFLGAQYQF